MNGEDLLKFAVNQGIINIDDVLNKMKQEERERILKKHKYKIYEESDGRVRTYIPDSTKKSKRRPIAKSSIKELEDALIDFYSTKEDEEKEREVFKTIRLMYPDWVKYKYNHTQSKSTIRRIQNDWNKYYEKNPIVDVLIQDLTYVTLDKWACDIVNNNKLTKKQYYNLTLIIRQVLDYCSLDGIDLLKDNPFSRIKMNPKLFRGTPKKKDETQVYLEFEEKEFCQTALDKYYKSQRYTTPLAIVLNFQLGLRVSELMALRFTDITGDYIRIENTEIADYVICENGEVIRNGVKIVNYTKSKSGERSLYLNKTAKDIIRLIKYTNMKYGYYDEDYLFVGRDNKRITTTAVNKCIYKVCDDIDINKKSSHKIRKTYISSLFDGHININRIREIAGHEDERTSLNNYCFDRASNDDIQNKLEQINSNYDLRINLP